MVVCAHRSTTSSSRSRSCAATAVPGTLITDAGSTKAEIVAELEQAVTKPAGARRALRRQPSAGRQRKTRARARPRRSVRRTARWSSRPIEQSRGRGRGGQWPNFGRALGAEVVQMPAEEHDRALAATSHLPHLVAAAIAGATPERYVTLTAGGWQDTTRIAAGDPALWRQIMLANRDNLLAALDQFDEPAGRVARRRLRHSDAAATGTTPDRGQAHSRCCGKLTSIRPPGSPTEPRSAAGSCRGRIGPGPRAVASPPRTAI